MAIPHRHGAAPQKMRGLVASLRWLIRGEPEASPSQWRALGDGLLIGDPTTDQLLAWMRSYGFGAARALFERAVESGITDDAPEPLRAYFELLEQPPAWVDPIRLQRGARACGISGLTGLFVLRDLALMGGYQASAINRTLVLTGALKNGAQRRLAHTTQWWIDCTGVGGMERFGVGFRSTLRVRLVHAMVRQHIRGLDEWDEVTFGAPVNQTDMAVTYLGFCVMFLFGQRLMGVPLTRQEGDDVMHLWRYIGWVMGVDESRLCDSEMSGRLALYQNLVAQAPPDDSSVALGQALMDEPLDRHYPRFAKIRGRFDRARHLSIERFLLGRSSMRDLGLPTDVLPWYPLLSIGPLVAWHGLHRLLPGGRGRLERRGRKAQVDYLRIILPNDARA